MLSEKDWYLDLLNKLNMKIITINTCNKTLYTTIIFDFKFHLKIIHYIFINE